MEMNVYADHWAELLLTRIIYAMVLVCLAIAIWRAVSRRFPPYWSACAILLILGVAFVVRPISGHVPVDFWDLVVRIGQLSLFVGVIAVIGGSIAMRRPPARSK